MIINDFALEVGGEIFLEGGKILLGGSIHHHSTPQMTPLLPGGKPVEVRS